MFKTTRKILDLLSSSERKKLYLLFAALLCVSVVEMMGIASILPFMAVVANPDIIYSNRWLKQVYDLLGLTSQQSFLLFLGIVMLGLLVFTNLFKALTVWWTLKYDNQLNYALGRKLLAAYLARPYEFYLNRNTAELGKNILSETRNVIASVLSPSMQALASAILSFFILALLVVVNPLIAFAIFLALGGSYALIYWLVQYRLASLGYEQMEANTMKYKVSSEALAGIKDLKILGREMVFLERYAVHAQRHAWHNATVGIISQLPRYFLEIIAFGGILLIVLFNLESQQTASAIVPILALYAFAGYRLLPALQQFFASISMVRYGLPALYLVHRDLVEARPTVEPEIVLAETKKELQALPFTREFEIKNVTYAYPNTQEPSINKISLIIAPNTSIGFVGATGSGKTTIVDIILGLLQPTYGQLLVDGIEISGPNLTRWQRNLGYVPQHIYLCDDTISRNIAFGVPDGEVDMKAVVRVARIANLHTFIESELPEQYQTVIGERGLRLSGGQRQRIGIARALYNDPKVLIMDEATSALDGITEEAVMEALRNLSGKKTVIMIAHRLTTVKDCDQIYHLDRGRIVNQGTYQELLSSSKWFQAAAKSHV